MRFVSGQAPLCPPDGSDGNAYASSLNRARAPLWAQRCAVKSMCGAVLDSQSALTLRSAEQRESTLTGHWDDA